MPTGRDTTQPTPPRARGWLGALAKDRPQQPGQPPKSKTQAATESAEKVGGKGRATPSRRQAEAANRRPLVPQARPGTTDKTPATKEARARAREQRNAQRQAEDHAMRTGDEAHMPAQHRGPVRRYVRDVVDSHRMLSQYLLPLVLVMFLAMMLSGPLAAQSVTGARIAMALSLLPYAYFIVTAADLFRRWRALKPVLTRKFGAAGTARGTAIYFIARSSQLRRTRMPVPQVKPGDLPR